jgi:hypothetical protein
MIKICPTEMSEVLSYMFKIFTRLKCVPQLWKTALICLVYKNKGDPHEVNNYRPIALTSSVRRVFERCLIPYLLELDILLEKSQCGFRKKRSTYDQILILETIMKENQELYHCFLDIKAAYDCVDRRILWKRLIDKGINRECLILMRELFDGNASHIVLNGIESASINNSRGLLQGSSLSPILFNHFINSLIVRLNTREQIFTLNVKSNNLFFADDAAIHAKSPEILQDMLNDCYNWSLENGINFAPSKSVILSKDKQSTFYMGNEKIPQRENFKYLGIYFNEEGIDWLLSVNPRIENVKKLSEWMSSIGFNINGWRPACNVMVYKSFLRPVLEYGFSVQILPQDILRELQKVQNGCLRRLFSAAPNTSIAGMHALTNIVPIEYRNQELHCRYIAKVLDLNPDQHMVSEIISQNFDMMANIIELKCWEIASTNQAFNVLRREAITSMIKKKGNVADRIPINISGKMNTLLTTSRLEKNVQKTLIYWRLGRIAYHQDCQNNRCGQPLSRKHATECVDLMYTLRQKLDIADLQGANTSNALDMVLNNLDEINEDNVEKFMVLYECIQRIRRLCLGWRKNLDGILVGPRNPSFPFEVP